MLFTGLGKRSVLFTTAMLGLAPVPALAIEDIAMNASVDIQDNHVVARWLQGGYDVYHIGWRENGGPRHATERDGDKRFVFLTVYRPGAVYAVEVQGCIKHALGHDECTSWTETGCGEKGAPCRAGAY